MGPSLPFFLKELQPQPFKERSIAVLEARVVGVPIPSVEWLKDGQPLNNYRYAQRLGRPLHWLRFGVVSIDKYHFRISTEYEPQTGICMLTIPQLFEEDLGEYAIRASNNVGTTFSSARVWPLVNE